MNRFYIWRWIRDEVFLFKLTAFTLCATFVFPDFDYYVIVMNGREIHPNKSCNLHFFSHNFVRASPLLFLRFWKALHIQHCWFGCFEFVISQSFIGSHKIFALFAIVQEHGLYSCSCSTLCFSWVNVVTEDFASEYELLQTSMLIGWCEYLRRSWHHEIYSLSRSPFLLE